MPDRIVRGWGVGGMNGPTRERLDLLSLPDEDAYTSRLLDSFPFFMRELFHCVGLERHHPIGWVEDDVLEFAANGPAHRAILAWRFFGKTYLVSAGLTTWSLFRDPEFRTLIVSKSELHSKQTIKLIKGWISSVWFLRHMAPRSRIEDSTTKAFTVRGATIQRAYSVIAEGITGQITGQHVNLVVSDDVETKDNSRTKQGRLDLLDATTEYHAIATMGRGEILYLGTPHHEDTLYAKLPRRGVVVRSYPKTYPFPGENTIGAVAPAILDRMTSGAAQPGDIVAPHRVSREQITRDKAQGQRYWFMQCQLVANAHEGSRYPLSLEDLIVMDLNRDRAPVSVTYGRVNESGSTVVGDIEVIGLGDERLYGPAAVDEKWAPYGATYAFIDPAGKGEDETACAVVATLGAIFFCKGILALRGGPTNENIDALLRFCRAMDARMIGVEPNIDIFDKFGELLMSRLPAFSVKPGERDDELRVHPTGWSAVILPRDDSRLRSHGGFKEERIVRTIEPVLSSHRLVVDRSVVRPEDGVEPEYQFQHQLSRIVVERKALEHDDRLEALAGGIRLHEGVLRQDPGSAGRRAKESLLDRLIRRGLASKLPNHPSWRARKPANWINR